MTVRLNERERRTVTTESFGRILYQQTEEKTGIV